MWSRTSGSGTIAGGELGAMCEMGPRAGLRDPAIYGVTPPGGLGDDIGCHLIFDLGDLVLKVQLLLLKAP